jgi:hypothetical protein
LISTSSAPARFSFQKETALALEPEEKSTVEEAIAILNASKVVKAHALGPRVMAKITEFYTKGNIVFDPGMAASKYGDSFENPIWARIRLHTAWIEHPITVATVLAHEAVHLVSNTEDQVEEELECRAFDVQLLAELKAGSISYRFERPEEASLMATGPLKTAMMKLSYSSQNAGAAPASPIMGTYYDLEAAAKANQLIDMILAVELYASLLKAGWLVSHLNDWGGLGNRKPTTLGVFVRALVCADQRPAFFAPYILQVLQALPAGHWTQAKAAMGDFGRVQAMMTYIEKLDVPANGAAIDALEKKFNDKFRLF